LFLLFIDIKHQQNYIDIACMQLARSLCGVTDPDGLPDTETVTYCFTVIRCLLRGS